MPIFLSHEARVVGCSSLYYLNKTSDFKPARFLLFSQIKCQKLQIKSKPITHEKNIPAKYQMFTNLYPKVYKVTDMCLPACISKCYSVKKQRRAIYYPLSQRLRTFFIETDFPRIDCKTFILFAKSSNGFTIMYTSILNVSRELYLKTFSKYLPKLAHSLKSKLLNMVYV